MDLVRRAYPAVQVWLNVLTDWQARANSAIFSLDERVTELERRPGGGGAYAVEITTQSSLIPTVGGDGSSVVAFLDSTDGAVQVQLQDGLVDGQEVKCIAVARVNTIRIHATIQPASGPALDHITFLDTGQSVILVWNRARQTWFVAHGGFSA